MAATRNRRKAFTLLELIIVLLLFAMLEAILLPVFGRARAKAYNAQCSGNLQNIGAALRIYAADYNGLFPPARPGLPALVQLQIVPDATLHCPVTVRWQLKRTRYLYRPGLSDDGRPMELVCADPYRDVHNDGFFALWTDGHVKWVNYRQVEQRPEQFGPGAKELLEQMRTVEEARR